MMMRGSVSLSNKDDPNSDKNLPQKYSENLTKITFLRAAKIKLGQPCKWPHEMKSFEEAKHEKISKTKPNSMIEYCKEQMARIYPSGTRVNSSNYCPIKAWNMGCQLVALNCQTPDEPMSINQAKFEDNGNCGYVLKPPIMMLSNNFGDLICDNPIHFQAKNPNTIHGTLKVEVIGARMLPEPTRNKRIRKYKPSVFIKMVGIDTDTRQHDHFNAKTNDMFIPHWNHPPFYFKVEMGQMALLIVRIDQGKGGPPIASYCIPVKCLREGYRVLTLRNTEGVISPFSTMLVHFSWSE